ncbi:MAG: hypothetical protein F9K46_08935, partial [Anaerolineae bacterium]
MSLILLGLAVITPTHWVVLGQGDEPTLIPFTDETYSIQGLVPEGWNEIAPGVYARALTMTDVALVAEQSTPGTLETTLNALVPQLGLTEAPESVGTVESDALTWVLYQVDVVTVQVDLGLAEADGKTYIVVLQASSDEY